MELFWILFGLGYGAYRNVKDQLPIKKTDGAYTHTTFQTYFALPIYTIIIFLFDIIMGILSRLAEYIDDYLNQGWSFSEFISVIAIIIGIACLVWVVIGPSIASKWAKAVEQRISIVSGEEISPKHISTSQGNVLAVVYIALIIVVIIGFSIIFASSA